MRVPPVTSPCYPPGPLQASEWAPSPPLQAVLFVPLSPSAAEPGSPAEQEEEKSECTTACARPDKVQIPQEITFNQHQTFSFFNSRKKNAYLNIHKISEIKTKSVHNPVLMKDNYLVPSSVHISIFISWVFCYYFIVFYSAIQPATVQCPWKHNKIESCRALCYKASSAEHLSVIWIHLT